MEGKDEKKEGRGARIIFTCPSSYISLSSLYRKLRTNLEKQLILSDEALLSNGDYVISGHFVIALLPSTSTSAARA